MAEEEHRRGFGRTPGRALGNEGVSIALVLLALVGAVCAALAPALAVGVAAAAAVCAVAVRAPSIGFVGALVLVGSEGLLKARLVAEDVPSAVAVGAILIDLTLAVVVARLFIAGGTGPLDAVWRRASRGERIVWSLVAAWLVISVLQVIVLSPDLRNAIEGFRLTQAYVLLVPAGVLLYAVHSGELRLTKALLVGLAVLSAFAAFRAVVEPSAWESEYLVERSEHAMLGGVLRVAGSFTTAVALASYLVPAAVFGLIVGFLEPRVRALAWATFALALVGIIESYARTAILGLGVGAATLAVLLLVGRGVPRRTRTLAVVAVLAVGVGAYLAAVAVGGRSVVTAERAQGLRDPFSDDSLRIRWRTWERSAEAIADDVVAGSGIGTVGRATEVAGRHAFTDNAYLKVLQEQGLAGVLFIVGVFGSVVLVGARVARAGPTRQPVAVAAIGAVVSFLALCVLQEYIELAGKALVWSMLGIAIWQSSGARSERISGQATPLPSRDRKGGPASIVRRLRRLPPAQRVGMALTIGILLVVPALVASARPSRVWSEVELSSARRDVPVTMLVADVRQALRGADTRITAAGGASGVVVRTPGATARDARNAALMLATRLVADSRRIGPRERAASRRRLAAIDRALRDPALTSSRRVMLGGQRRFILALMAPFAHTGVLAISRPPSVPSRNRVARLVEEVNPDGAYRPSAWWVFAAGLLLALGTCLLWLARRPRAEAPIG